MVHSAEFWDVMTTACLIVAIIFVVAKIADFAQSREDGDHQE